MIVKIAGIAVLSVLSILMLKKDRAEIAFILELCTVVILLILILPYFENIVSVFSDISKQVGIEYSFISVLLKCSGIAAVAKLISELCIDAGEHALSAKVELAAKILIMTQALPIVATLFELIVSLTESVI